MLVSDSVMLLIWLFQKGKKCSRMEKPKQPVKLTYAGCSSVKKYWPKYCGSCLDGRCCRPEQTRTLPVQFHCDNGETFTKDVMMIQSCKCSTDCPLRFEGPLPRYRLENDIHRFTEEWWTDFYLMRFVLVHHSLNLLLDKITGVARRKSWLHAKKCDATSYFTS